MLTYAFLTTYAGGGGSHVGKAIHLKSDKLHTYIYTYVTYIYNKKYDYCKWKKNEELSSGETEYFIHSKFERIHAWDKFSLKNVLNNKILSINYDRGNKNWKV